MSRNFERIKEFLQSENIEYISALKADKLSVINERIMPKGAKSCVVFFIPYYTGEHKDRNVSLYSVSRDYHLYIKELSGRFCGDNTHYYSFFSDTSPVNERLCALCSGLGFRGENGLVYSEKYGSFIFIGTVITDATFDESEYAYCEKIKECDGCGNCKKACAFLRGESDVCFSALNQKKSVNESELEAIRTRPIIWGCDDCQLACPHNKNVEKTPIEFFYKDIIEKIDIDMIENMSKDEFSRRAYSWRGKKTLLRNLGWEE